MVKWIKENQNKIVLAIGMILAAGIAFGAGLLVNYKEQKEPLVLSENTAKASPIAFSLQGTHDNLFRAKTDPEVTVKLGEEILQLDGEGNFEFNLDKFTNLTLYNENNIVSLNLDLLKNLITESAALPQTAESKKEAPLSPTTTVPTPAVVKQNPTQSLPQETPQIGQFVGSKNSTKYHLPTCRFAKNIKPENQVWFSSAADAASRGYEPCGTCIK